MSFEYEESEYLMLSGIQHFFYCRRQWALIHIEQVWQDNELTVLGNEVHERVHDPALKEKRKNVVTVRGMKISSRTAGISGECDVVEFIQADATEGVSLQGYRGTYKIYPVEYKRGKPKSGMEDIMQLVLEAICLEEMFGATISEGALFYDQIKRRQRIDITTEMKDEARQAVKEMHQLIERHHVPVQKYSKKCDRCSLKELCLPEMQKQNPEKYIEAYIGELL
ncbi:CRISPR-associated protein Cas4 [Allobaculum sp. JKK-2023]|uniref:CRISPR-associated protein Cas4 n=1 Tax=Allobaculum sp. JKK-2023 TaxID=3108943 RepID=UPI002B05F135|nr:CRISPR-associated protein Cas4 [Allobaculum sp. JKK-2023]